MAKAARKLVFVPDDARDAVIEECAKSVPTNWCDVLLTGPDAPKDAFDNRDVERLLRGIQDRIRGLKSAPNAEER